MKATRKVVADAIECLLTCAEKRTWGHYACTWNIAGISYAAERLAGNMYSEQLTLEDEPSISTHAQCAHYFASAASLLHGGWLPEGWTR